MTEDKLVKPSPAPDREAPPPKPDEPKTVREAVADQVDELLRSIRSD